MEIRSCNLSERRNHILQYWHSEILCDKRRICRIVINLQTQGKNIRQDGRLRLTRSLQTGRVKESEKEYDAIVQKPLLSRSSGRLCEAREKAINHNARYTREPLFNCTPIKFLERCVPERQHHGDIV